MQICKRIKINSYQLIKSVLLFFLFVLNFSKLPFAQENLVPNGSFEEYISCPVGFADFSVQDWYMPTFGSSDYYNTCGEASASVPLNYGGKQAAKTGQAYCAFASGFEFPTSGYREYIQVMLTQPLVEDRDYIFKCFLSLAEISKYCTSDVGIALSIYPLGGLYSSEIPTTSFKEENNSFYCDTVKWTELSILYTAFGGERYLTIGVFENDQSCSITTANDAGIESAAYYYIDDVSLTSYDFQDIPNCFTPNNDGVNDLWSFSTPSGFEVSIVNRWGDLVYKSSTIAPFYSWNGLSTDGASCNDGVYFYTISKKDIRKTGFFQLMR